MVVLFTSKLMGEFKHNILQYVSQPGKQANGDGAMDANVIQYAQHRHSSPQ
jgi:hypothetical protein